MAMSVMAISAILSTKIVIVSKSSGPSEFTTFSAKFFKEAFFSSIAPSRVALKKSRVHGASNTECDAVFRTGIWRNQCINIAAKAKRIVKGVA